MLAGSILVAFASRHRGTEEMATEIAGALRDEGCEVDLRPAGEVATTEAYGAIIVGSAVYMARWESPALELVRRERGTLAQRPVWLFSSGPVGDGRSTRHPETVPQPDGVDELADDIGARGRAMFGGRIDARQGGFAMAIMMEAGLEGDWRDVPRVRSWALQVAATLHAAG